MPSLNLSELLCPHSTVPKIRQVSGRRCCHIRAPGRCFSQWMRAGATGATGSQALTRLSVDERKPMAPMRLVILCQFFRKSFLGITVPYVIIIESSMFMIMIHFRRYIQPCLGHWDGNMLCDPCPQCVRKWSIWRVERLAPTVPSNCGTHCPRIWPKKGPKRSGCDEQFLLDFWHPPETPTRNEFLAC